MSDTYPDASSRGNPARPTREDVALVSRPKGDTRRPSAATNCITGVVCDAPRRRGGRRSTAWRHGTRMAKQSFSAANVVRASTSRAPGAARILPSVLDTSGHGVSRPRDTMERGLSTVTAQEKTGGTDQRRQIFCGITRKSGYLAWPTSRVSALAERVSPLSALGGPHSYRGCADSNQGHSPPRRAVPSRALLSHQERRTPHSPRLTKVRPAEMLLGASWLLGRPAATVAAWTK